MSQYQKRMEQKSDDLFSEYRHFTQIELLALLNNADSLKRETAARILHFKGDHTVVALAKKLCSNKNYKQREIGALILQQIKIADHEIEEINKLLLTLASSDKSILVKTSAIYALAHRCRLGFKNYKPLLNLLKKTVYSHSARIRSATTFAFSCFYDKDAIPLLLDLLQDEDDEIRNWAAFAININEYNSKKIRDKFAVMLTDPYEEVRYEVIQGLAKRKDKRVTPILQKELQKKTIYDVYIEATGELGDKSLLPTLHRLLENQDDGDNLIKNTIRKLGD